MLHILPRVFIVFRLFFTLDCHFGFNIIQTVYSNSTSSCWVFTVKLYFGLNIIHYSISTS